MIIRSLQGIGDSKGPLLEIETLGAEGLRYRSRIAGARTHCWERLDAFEVTELRDAAGAGDWFTAGIIHRLAQQGSRGLMNTRPRQVEDALRFGQALAAWNCGYLGARGGMYAMEKKTFQLQVESIISQDGSKIPKREVPAVPVRKAFECICPRCMPTGSTYDGA